MTKVLVTIDTELSALLHQRGVSLRGNFDSSILGRCARGEYGVGWQAQLMTQHGIKGVFFVDPLPCLIYGSDWLKSTCDQILGAGHEVQLHIHTEWLEWAGAASPVGATRGQNLADFSYDDQVALLNYAIDLLVAAEAPRPVAFRAGNYGANDDSLRAIAALGLTWDSSVNAPFLGGTCRISADPDCIAPFLTSDVVEVPVSGINDRERRVRPAQICALSASEMRAALNHAAENNHQAFTIVTHSFEMLSRDRQRPNRSVIARFESMCHAIAANPLLQSSGFIGLDVAATREPELRLGPNRWRTYRRIAEQALATWRYERQLRPV